MAGFWIVCQAAKRTQHVQVEQHTQLTSKRLHSNSNRTIPRIVVPGIIVNGVAKAHKCFPEVFVVDVFVPKQRVRVGKVWCHLCTPWESLASLLFWEAERPHIHTLPCTIPAIAQTSKMAAYTRTHTIRVHIPVLCTRTSIYAYTYLDGTFEKFDCGVVFLLEGEAVSYHTPRLWGLAVRCDDLAQLCMHISWWTYLGMCNKPHGWDYNNMHVHVFGCLYVCENTYG